MKEIRSFIFVPNRRVKKNPELTTIYAMMFLETLGLSQEFHVLPRSGGLFDQDSLFVYLMKHAIVWQREKAELEAHKNAHS